MRQTVQVLRQNGRFCTVAMHRESACGGNCAGCGGCAPGDLFEALAENSAGAQAGDTVVVETSSHALFGIAALVYLVPVILLIAGYLVAEVLFTNPSLPGLLSGIGFLAGLLIVVFYGRGAGNRVHVAVVEIRSKHSAGSSKNEQ